MKTLYITDLDGTLLDSRSQVSPATARMLNEAIDSGKLVSLATARTPATISRLMSGVRLQVPVVCMTGTALWNPATGIYSDVRHFDPATVNEVRRVYERHALPYFLYTLRDNMINIYHRGAVSETERRFIDDRLDSPYKHFEIPASGSSDIPERVDDAILFFAMQPCAPAERAYEEMKSVKGVNPINYFDPTYGPDLSMSEAFPAHATKAAAARRLAESLGATRIVAFGDNVNDLPLLREADVAVAVAYALPEVRAAADIVIGGNDSDAVAKFIIHDA